MPIQHSFLTFGRLEFYSFGKIYQFLYLFQLSMFCLGKKKSPYLGHEFKNGSECSFHSYQFLTIITNSYN